MSDNVEARKKKASEDENTKVSKVAKNAQEKP